MGDDPIPQLPADHKALIGQLESSGKVRPSGKLPVTWPSDTPGDVGDLTAPFTITD